VLTNHLQCESVNEVMTPEVKKDCKPSASLTR